MDDIKIETKVIPQKKRVTTSFEIGDLKEPWEAYCRAHNIDSGPALCQVIQKLTGADPSKMPQSARNKTQLQAKGPAEPYTVREGTEKQRHRIYLSLTESEKLAVEAQAEADGFKKDTAWVIALIRARLTSQPQFGSREVELLGESNHQLLAIGRNLNQIAHALNAAKGKSINAYDVELVEELADAVKRHVRKVGDALRASIHRWTLE